MRNRTTLAEVVAMFQGLLQLDRYLGFDLVSAAAGLAGLYLLGNRNRYGFLLCLVASAFGIAFAALALSAPLLLLHVILLFVNLRGFFKWQAGLA
jgi:nicotinamide riboside transporter PnuC